MTQINSGPVLLFHKVRISPPSRPVVLASPNRRAAFALIPALILFIFTNLGRSDPLDTWHQVYQSPSYVTLSQVAWGNGLFVALGSGINTFSETSSDGTNWVIHQSGASPYRLSYGNGLFVGLDSAGPWTSTDGVNWTIQPG